MLSRIPINEEEHRSAEENMLEHTFLNQCLQYIQEFQVRYTHSLNVTENKRGKKVAKESFTWLDQIL